MLDSEYQAFSGNFHNNIPSTNSDIRPVTATFLDWPSLIETSPISISTPADATPLHTLAPRGPSTLSDFAPSKSQLDNTVGHSTLTEQADLCVERPYSPCSYESAQLSDLPALAGALTFGSTDTNLDDWYLHDLDTVLEIPTTDVGSVEQTNDSIPDVINEALLLTPNTSLSCFLGIYDGGQSPSNGDFLLPEMLSDLWEDSKKDGPENMTPYISCLSGYDSTQGLPSAHPAETPAAHREPDDAGSHLADPSIPPTKPDLLEPPTETHSSPFSSPSTASVLPSPLSNVFVKSSSHKNSIPQSSSIPEKCKQPAKDESPSVPDRKAKKRKRVGFQSDATFPSGLDAAKALSDSIREGKENLRCL